MRETNHWTEGTAMREAGSVPDAAREAAARASAGDWWIILFAEVWQLHLAADQRTNAAMQTGATRQSGPERLGNARGVERSG